MDGKDHNELVKQFPKPDVPALHVPELDRWLVPYRANKRYETFDGSKIFRYQI
jgi:hypothetical protein